MPGMNSTPSADRIHIAIYGRRNSGKSSLINALTGQQTALVSDVAGTTTDPVSKPMEVRGLGACVLIDTAGYDDSGKLGKLRVERTRETLPKADIAILAVPANLPADSDLLPEYRWVADCRERKIPVLAVINKMDLNDAAILKERIRKEWKLEPLFVSALTGAGIEGLLAALGRLLPEDYHSSSITGSLVRPGDTVLLVMPQDAAAPKGRLILPQVQTIRDLLDNRCVIVSTTPDTMENALAALKQPPSLIITDSQAFQRVTELTPAESRLTSFSVLFAAHKGDLTEFIEGASAADSLTKDSRVLIAEACTHAPVGEDIGRVKIPALLRKKFGAELQVDIVAGTDFPLDLSNYDLIIHCGGCMFNRSYLISRIEQAKKAGIPITNYGILLAKLNGILDSITLPTTPSRP